MVLLARTLRFKYYRATNFSAQVEAPLALLWIKIMDDDDAVDCFAEKKKAAAKLLLRFISHCAGEESVVGFRNILNRLNGFIQVYEPELLKSCKSLPKSNLTVDDDD